MAANEASMSISNGEYDDKRIKWLQTLYSNKPCNSIYD